MRTFHRTLAALAVVALALGTGACSKKSSPEVIIQSSSKVEVSIEPVEVVQAKLPPPAVMANFATTLAVNQYVQARLLTEEFATADFARADSMGLSQSLMEALLALEDAATLSEEAAALAATVEEDLGEPSRESASERRSRDRDSKEWTEPFSRPFDPAEVVSAQADLLVDLQDDIEAIADALEDVAEILNSPGSPSKRDLREAESLAKDVHSLPVVDLSVTSTALPESGSIRELVGSDVSGDTHSRVVLTGVDAIAMVGPRSSSVMVGANQQVVLEETDMPSDANEVDAVLGFTDLTPKLNVDVSKDVPNVVLPIGSRPSSWLLPQTLISVQVTNILVEPTLILADIPWDDDAVAEAALNGLGVPMRGAPDISITEITTNIWIDTADALVIIDEMATELEPEEKDTKEEPASPAPAEKQPAVQPTSSISGSYTWYSYGDDGETGGNAYVSQEGGSMSIDFDGGVWLGTYDTSTQTFVGYDAGYKMTLYFYPTQGGVTAEGEVVDDFTRNILSLTKVG